MGQLSRVGWTMAYEQMRAPMTHFASRFTMKEGGIFFGDEVEMDIISFGEEIATVVTQHTGPNMNDYNKFTTKKFKPPAYNEGFPLDVNELLSRMAGVDPYSAAYLNWQGDVVSKIMKGFRLLDDKITRGVELQASQILQTGKLNLFDDKGNITYTLDFKPKASHFPTVTVPWSTVATATPLEDIRLAAKQIFTNGKITPKRLTFGESAWENFKNNATVQKALDIINISVGQVAPMEMAGGIHQGTIWIGSYKYEMWTCPGEYTHPSTGLPVEYLDTHKVIVDSPETRLDIVCAGVPLPFPVDQRLSMLLPQGRLTNRKAGFDVSPNIWISPNNKQVTGELESRPLCVPAQINGFACVKTNL